MYNYNSPSLHNHYVLFDSKIFQNLMGVCCNVAVNLYVPDMSCKVECLDQPYCQKKGGKHEYSAGRTVLCLGMWNTEGYLHNLI